MHCPGVYHRGDTLEKAVIADILELAKKPELRASALAAAREKVRDNEAPVKDEVSQLSARLSELDALFEEWADRLDRRIIDESQFRNHNTLLMAEREKLSRSLGELQTKTAAKDADSVTLAQIENVLANMLTAWDNLQFEEKKEFLRLLIKRIAVFRDRVEVQFFHLPTRVVHARRAGPTHNRRRAERAEAQ
jgi:predicted nuclease with TOPRIM domain